MDNESGSFTTKPVKPKEEDAAADDERVKPKVLSAGFLRELAQRVEALESKIELIEKEMVSKVVEKNMSLSSSADERVNPKVLSTCFLHKLAERVEALETKIELIEKDMVSKEEENISLTSSADSSDSESKECIDFLVRQHEEVLFMREKLVKQEMEIDKLNREVKLLRK